MRISIAVLPVAWLARRVDLGATAHEVGLIGAVPVVGALALFALGVVLGTVRWAVLMRAYGATTLPPFRRMLRNMFIAGYFNVLPSGLAGDVFRALRVKGTLEPGASLTVIAMERVVGLVALLGIVGVTAVSGADLGVGPAALAFRVACAVAAGLSLGLLVFPWVVHRSPAARALVEKLPLGRGLLLRVAPAKKPLGVVVALALSFGTQILAMLIAEALLVRVASTEQLVAAAGALPFAILLSFVPITPGAVAQREAVYTLFLGLAGISADRAVAVAVLSFLVQLAMAAVGGLLYGAEKLGWLPLDEEKLAKAPS